MRVSCATALTWMRHLLTSLAQRALLQPEVRDSPERKRRRRAAAAAGRIVWPGLILTAHQRGTGNTYINTTHRTGTQRANKHKFHLQHSNKGGGSRAGTRCSEGPKYHSKPCFEWYFFFHAGFQLAIPKAHLQETVLLAICLQSPGTLNYWVQVPKNIRFQLPAETDALFGKKKKHLKR